MTNNLKIIYSASVIINKHMTKKPKLTDRRITAISMLVSLSDVSMNFIVALFTGSQVMMSQALQGLSDLATAMILFIGAGRSKKAPDKLHPLGYGREIYFWVLIAGVFMFIGTGLISLYIGWQQFTNPQPVTNKLVAVLMLLFGLITNYYAFSQSRNRIQGNKTKITLKSFLSSSMIETKATFMVDFLGTISAFLGLIAIGLLAITNNASFDGLGSMLVGLSMMLAALFLIYDVRGLIVGRTVDKQTEAKIISATKSIKGVEEVLDLRTLYLGSAKMLVLLEVHFADGLDVVDIEQLSDKIKNQVTKEVPHAYHIQVEAEDS